MRSFGRRSTGLLIGLLVRLYPGAWRTRYEDEFLALVEDRPPVPVDVFDIIRGALDARLHHQLPGREPGEGRPTMLTRFSGLAGAAGGLSWTLSWVLISSLAASGRLWDSDGTEAVPAMLLMVVGAALIDVGVLGVHARYGRDDDRVSAFATISFAGGAALAGALALLLVGIADPWGWLIADLGGIAFLIGSALLAAVLLNVAAWPRWASALLVPCAAVGGLGILGGAPLLFVPFGFAWAVVGLAAVLRPVAPRPSAGAA